jgi:trigger factor
MKNKGTVENMKATKIDSANAKVEATITSEEISAAVEKLAKRLTKTAKIDGFRKGKVPASAVKKQYGEKLVQDAEGEMVRKVLSDALTEMSISNDKLIGEPQVTKWEKSGDNIEIEIKIAMRPEIDLSDYKSIVPDFKVPKITKKAVTDRIAELAQAQAPFVTVEEDRALVEGDTSLIDFEGSVDGVPFDGGKAEGFSLTLGSGKFIPGFEDQVIGMKKGETKDINVTFPENYGGKELAGKDAVFKVTVHGIQTKEKVTQNDELAKKMLPGEESATLDMLKEKVEEQLLNEEKSKLYNEDLKPKLLDTFVEKFVFDLPEFVVEQEMDLELNKKARELSEDEINAIKDDADKVKELRESLRADATRSVRATFIIDALAMKEGINVAEQEVMQTIYFEAMQMGQDPSAVYNQYKESGYLPAVQMAMVEDKILTKILDDKAAAAA